MSFFHIPSTVASAFYPQQEQYQQYYVNNVDAPLSYLISSPPIQQSRQVERNVPFKVYVFDGKFNHNLNNASKVLRFEIDSNLKERSFELFDRVLREHSIDMRQYDLHYVDDENDLVSLSNSRDFQFMLKLMKSKLTKIVCEKKSITTRSQPFSQPHFIQIHPQQQQQARSIPSQSFTRTCPLSSLFAQFEQQPKVETQTRQSSQQQQQPKENSLESMLEKAFKSAFSVEEKPTQPKQSIFPQVATKTATASTSQQPKSEPKVRRIEINLADLFGFPTSSREESKNEQAKKQQEEKKSSPQSFRELLLQRMKEMRQEENSQQVQQSAQEKKQEEKPIQTSEPTVVPVQETKEENPIEETVQEQVKEEEITVECSTPTPNISTSLLLSNLIEDQSTESVNQEQVVEQSQEEPTAPVNEQDISKQEVENQDPIIESIPEEPIVKTTIPHKYQKELKLLNDMGFSNHILNITLLNKYEGDIQRTISDLIHQ